MLIAMVSGLYAFAAPPASGRATGPDRLIIRIGVIAPLSGMHAASGIDALNGARLAAERLNRQDTRIDGMPVHIDLVVRDDQADPVRGAAIANEFIRSGVHAVLGPFNSDVALAIAPLFDAAGLPMLTVASAPGILRAGPRASFRIAASDRDMGSKLAIYAADKLGLTRVAIISDGSAYAEGLRDAFEQQAHTLGLPADRVAMLPVATDEAALRMTVERLRQIAPDGVFYAGYVPSAVALLRQMQRSDIRLPVLAGDAQCSSEMTRLAAAYLSAGVYCVQGGVWLTRVSDGAVFAASYQYRFERMPDVYAASFYDGVMLIMRAMRAARSVRPAEVIEALARLRYKGMSGLFEFDADHALKETTVTILRLNADGSMPLASF